MARVIVVSCIAVTMNHRHCRSGLAIVFRAARSRDRGYADHRSSWHRHSRHDDAAVVEAFVPRHGLSGCRPAVGFPREAAVRRPTEAVARPVTSASHGPARGSPGRCSRPPRAARRVVLVRSESQDRRRPSRCSACGSGRLAVVGQRAAPLAQGERAAHVGHDYWIHPAERKRHERERRLLRLVASSGVVERRGNRCSRRQCEPHGDTDASAGVANRDVLTVLPFT
jgi:hypothetical protein